VHPRLPPGLLCQHVVGKVFGGRALVRLRSPKTVHSVRAQDTRLEHRFVDLRTPANQAIFRLQSAVCQVRGQAGQVGRVASQTRPAGSGPAGRHAELLSALHAFVLLPGAFWRAACAPVTAALKGVPGASTPSS